MKLASSFITVFLAALCGFFVGSHWVGERLIKIQNDHWELQHQVERLAAGLNGVAERNLETLDLVNRLAKVTNPTQVDATTEGRDKLFKMPVEKRGVLGGCPGGCCIGGAIGPFDAWKVGQQPTRKDYPKPTPPNPPIPSDEIKDMPKDGYK